MLRLAKLRPWLMSNGTNMSLDITAVVEDGRGDADLVRELANLLVLVADQLCSEFDRHHENILARQGPAAAEAWLRQQESAVQGVVKRRRMLKVAILAGVFLLVCAICGGSLLIGMASILIR
jgi:hypothetical protein